MDLKEVNELALGLLQRLDQKQQKLSELRELEAKAKYLSEEQRRLRKFSTISGIPYEDPTRQLQTQLKNLQDEIDSIDIDGIERKIMEGVAHLTLDLDPEPEIVEDKVVFKFKDEPCPQAISYLRDRFGFEAELDIDGVVFLDKDVGIQGAEDRFEATDRLISAVNTLKVFGSIALGKEPNEVKACREFLYRSKHRQIWEFLMKRGRTTLQRIYEQFGVMDRKEKVRIVAFLSDLQKRDISPVVSGGKGDYRLTVFGRQIKLQYEKSYVDQIVGEGEGREEPSPTMEAIHEANDEQTILNNWRRIILGDKWLLLLANAMP